MGRIIHHSTVYGNNFSGGGSDSITLLAAGITAGYLPARKAMKLDPMVALWQE
jgi:ABC-type antimicrobial peptide transport system permease subunit